MINLSFFSYIIGIHTPYSAPEDIYTEFKPKRKGKSKELKELLTNINNKEWKDYLLKAFGEQTTAEEVIAMYDSAIRYVDQEIGRLIDFLKDKRIYDNTIFVITSDHGESLTEHGIFLITMVCMMCPYMFL
nr:sulfatase-like hydrolase/transferase [Ferroglobus placidus]